MVRLQIVSQDLPAQFYAPSLAGCAVGGTAHLSGSDMGLRHLQDLGVTVLTEQLRQNIEETIPIKNLYRIFCTEK